MKEIKWLDQPEEHDYPAAVSYLSLIITVQLAKANVETLKLEKVSLFKAKDILRASELPILGRDNYHVKKDIKKIEEGKELSPILLVRYNNKVIIADGYHRTCAIYNCDEDSDVHVKII